MGAYEEAIERQGRQAAMEVERLRERAERAERERDALAEAWPDISVRQIVGHPMMPDGWFCCGQWFVGSHGPFGSKADAIRHSLGLDAAPTVKEPNP